MKLVRDNIPLLHDRGELGPHPSSATRSRQVFRRATTQEYRLLLLSKLAEEVGEVLSAMTREHRLEELGDLRDVIDAIESLEFFGAADGEKRQKKKLHYGDFAEGWVLEWRGAEG